MARRPEPSYKRRKAEDVKRHADQRGTRFDSIFNGNFDSYRPKAGENCIRILPAYWDSEDNHFGHEIWVHFSIGPDKSQYLCAKKMKNTPCPICDAAREAKEAGEEEESKNLSAKKQILCWVLDRKSDDDVPLTYQMAWTIDRDIAVIAQRDKSGVLKFDDIDNGYDLWFQRTGEGTKTQYSAFQFDREPTPVHESEKKQDKILDFISEHPCPDILKFYDVEYLEKLLSGDVEEKDPDKNDSDEERPRRRTRSDDKGEEEEKPRRRRADPDEEEEERPARRRTRDDDDEEEEERSSRRRSRDDDDEEKRPSRRRSRDDDSKEDDEPKRRRRTRDADDEDEDPAPFPRRASRDEEEEDEERPTKTGRRGKSDEHEEEERPARRRTRDDDDEEEKPSRRERVRGRDSSDDDEEEEERPRRRR